MSTVWALGIAFDWRDWGFGHKRDHSRWPRLDRWMLLFLYVERVQYP